LKSIISVTLFLVEDLSIFDSIKFLASFIERAYHIVLSHQPQIQKVGIQISFQSFTKAQPLFQPAINVSVFIYL